MLHTKLSNISKEQRELYLDLGTIRDTLHQGTLYKKIYTLYNSILDILATNTNTNNTNANANTNTNISNNLIKEINYIINKSYKRFTNDSPCLTMAQQLTRAKVIYQLLKEPKCLPTHIQH